MPRAHETSPGPSQSVKPVTASPQSRETTPEPTRVSCEHLHGEIYTEYTLRTQTRTLGGVSPTLRGRIARQLFGYKPFAPLRDGKTTEDLDVGAERVEPSSRRVPEEGNTECEERKWTLKEQLDLDHALAGWARWIVDYDRRLVKSTRCEGTTSNVTRVCDACQTLGERDAGLKRGVARV